ncbi:hypothetical protein [Hymenobacter radiodurans]|uniref:hypothetical protein n=1 Tax=Hymenobacter radiodurans TaxID=2496028 RepID=UPI00196A48C8|nr:hypothetical protein [Hymenobacter radiodurans]
MHVISLVSFRNRLIVLLNWAYTYFSYDKGLRYIIGARKDLPPVEDTQDKAIT